MTFHKMEINSFHGTSKMNINKNRSGENKTCSQYCAHCWAPQYKGELDILE